MLFKNKLFNNISWIKESNLGDILHNQQIYLNIDKSYRFSFYQELERENLNKIINLFKKEIINDYFKKHLDMDFKLWFLTEEEYFMYMFRFFLVTNELDKYHIFFRKYKTNMYDTKLVWHNENGCEDWIYTLTDFSTTYHKLFFTVQTYCETNQNIKKIIPYITNLKHSKQIKETLDKKQLDVIVR